MQWALPSEMCGICGIIDLSGSAADWNETLTSMCEAIDHRGPDGTRTLISDAAVLGHTRLSVIDTETGWQPIANEDESIFVILNGEIYNFKELRVSLEAAGHRFRTSSDTEVVVHLYEEKGVDFVNGLDGMFALAVWDSNAERLILARDRIGKKPLFYAEAERRLLFASEVKALTDSGPLDKQIDPSALASYLTYGYIAEPHCVFKGIAKLPPAHLLVYDRRGLRIEEYWRLNDEVDRSLSVGDAVDHTRSLVDRAVCSRLVSDVPLGFFLSGGVDSSIVVGAAAQASGVPLKTFSIGFEEDSYSELEYARAIASRFATEHSEFVVTADLAGDIGEIVHYADEPFADGSMIPTYYLSQQTRQHVTVALSGDGGDEVFAGYERYVGLRLSRLYHHVPAAIRKGLLARLAGAISESPGKHSRLRRLKRLLYPATDSPEQWYMGVMQQFRSETHARAFTPEFASAVSESQGWDDRMAAAFAERDDPATTKSAQYVDTTTYLPGDLMVKADRMSMAHGLEVRSPFLDHHVVEFASTIPGEYSMSGGSGKQVLKRAYADLIPSSILRRRKAGFTVPVGKWINGPLRQSTRELLLSSTAEVRKIIRPGFIERMVEQHESRQHDHAVRLWNLVCLETWTRAFGVALG